MTTELIDEIKKYKSMNLPHKINRNHMIKRNVFLHHVLHLFHQRTHYNKNIIKNFMMWLYEKMKVYRFWIMIVLLYPSSMKLRTWWNVNYFFYFIYSFFLSFLINNLLQLILTLCHEFPWTVIRSNDNFHCYTKLKHLCEIVLRI